MWVVSWMCPDVSFLTACVRVCFMSVWGCSPGPRTGGRAHHHPNGSQPATSSWSVLPASLLDSQPNPGRPSVCLLQVLIGGADIAPGPACPLVPLPGWHAWGCGQHLPALPVLSKERIIIPGQAASATNLREIIVERVERQKLGTSIQPSIRVIK